MNNQYAILWILLCGLLACTSDNESIDLAGTWSVGMDTEGLSEAEKSVFDEIFDGTMQVEFRADSSYSWQAMGIERSGRYSLDPSGKTLRMYEGEDTSGQLVRVINSYRMEVGSSDSTLMILTRIYTGSDASGEAMAGNNSNKPTSNAGSGNAAPSANAGESAANSSAPPASAGGTSANPSSAPAMGGTGGGSSSIGGGDSSDGFLASWELVSVVDGQGRQDQLTEGLELGTRFVFLAGNGFQKVLPNRTIEGNFSRNDSRLTITTELGREQSFVIDKVDNTELVLRENSTSLVRTYRKAY